MIMQHVRLAIENYFAWQGKLIEKDRLMQYRLPEDVWARVETFLRRLSGLPAWIDKNLSNTVFGAKQNRDFWAEVFKTGRSTTGVQVFTGPINVIDMMQESGSGRTR